MNHPDRALEGRTMRVKGFVTLAVLLAIVIFTVQNNEVVTVDFLFWSFPTSRALLIFLMLVIGILLGWLSAPRGRTKTSKR